MDRKASGYLESVFAVMVISISLTLLVASLSLALPGEGGTGLEAEAEAWMEDILHLLSDDGISINGGDLGRVEGLSWRSETATGMRIDIHVLGSNPWNQTLRVYGMAPGEQDDCYALRTPVNLVESPQEVSAAVLSVVVW